MLNKKFNGLRLELNGAGFNEHQLHYTNVEGGTEIYCTDEIHSSPETASAIHKAVSVHDDLATAFCQAMEMLLVDPINMTKEERREMHRKYVELEKVKHSLSEAK